MHFNLIFQHNELNSALEADGQQAFTEAEACQAHMCMDFAKNHMGKGPNGKRGPPEKPSQEEMEKFKAVMEVFLIFIIFDND